MIFAKTKSFIENNFHSLYHKNYRYFFFGQLISVTGTWMQVMAQAWLVYTITNSAVKLGIVSVLQFLPMLVLSSRAQARFLWIIPLLSETSSVWRRRVSLSRQYPIWCRVNPRQRTIAIPPVTDSASARYRQPWISSHAPQTTRISTPRDGK